MNRNDRTPILHAIAGFAAVVATVGTVSATILLPARCPGTDPNIAVARGTVTVRASETAAAPYSITVVASRNAA